MGCKFKYADGRLCGSEEETRYNVGDGLTYGTGHCRKHKARYERQRTERQRAEHVAALRKQYAGRKATLDKIEEGPPGIIKCEELQAIALELLSELLVSDHMPNTINGLRELFKDA